MFAQEDYGESIYNIIPPKVVPQEKPPMYRSKHNGTVPPTASTFHQPGTSMPGCSNLAGEMNTKPVPDRSGRQMGKAPGALKPDPKNRPMPTKSKVATLSEVKQSNPECLQPSQLKPKMKADVPKKDDAPVMNLVTTKNFVVANAVETILAAPKKGSQGAQDYLSKQDYGKTPKYLSNIKQDLEDEGDYIRQLVQQREEENRSMVRPMEEKERQQLIEGLKSKWESVNAEYQAATHLTKLDTVGKIRRKEQYEAQLSQIEKDIEKLNRRNILINQMA